MVDNRQVTDPAIMLWTKLLGHIDYDDAVWALRQHRLTQAGKYFEPGSVTQQLAARRQSAALKPLEQTQCDIHEGYILGPDGDCHQCTRFPEDRPHFLATGERPAMLSLGALTAPIGKQP